MRSAEERTALRAEKKEKRAEEKRRKKLMRSIRPTELVVPDLIHREREKLVLPFETEAENLKESFRAGESEMQDFYVRMAESPSPEELRNEVLDRAQSWRRSGDSLAASSLRSYEIADEVSARFNDLTKAKKKTREKMSINIIFQIVYQIHIIHKIIIYQKMKIKKVQ